MVPPVRCFALVVPLATFLSLACGSSTAPSLTSAKEALTSSAATSAPGFGAASTFAVLSAAPAGAGAVTCTDSTITGDVGSSGPSASVVKTNCTIKGSIIAPVSAQVSTDFNSAYDAFAALACDHQSAAVTLGTQTIAPGVYCFDAALTSTGAVVTLDAKGNSNAVWIFKIGTLGTGALTTTDFSVVLANGAQPCNVFWWVAQAATTTNSNFVGTILAGAAITQTGGTFNGDALAKAGVTITGPATLTSCALSGGPPSCTDEDGKKCKCKDKDDDEGGNIERDKKHGHADECDHDDDDSDHHHDDGEGHDDDGDHHGDDHHDREHKKH